MCRVFAEHLAQNMISCLSLLILILRLLILIYRRDFSGFNPAPIQAFITSFHLCNIVLYVNSVSRDKFNKSRSIARKTRWRGSKLKIDIFKSRAHSNFRWKIVASLFTCAYSISFHSRHESPISPNRIRQILNRKSIIAQLDLNLCNSTVIRGTSVNLDRVHKPRRFCTTFSLYLHAATHRGILVALLIGELPLM